MIRCLAIVGVERGRNISKRAGNINKTSGNIGKTGGNIRNRGRNIEARAHDIKARGHDIEERAPVMNVGGLDIVARGIVMKPRGHRMGVSEILCSRRF